MLIEKIKNYFHFTRGEKNALIIIISAIFLLLLLRFFTAFILPVKTVNHDEYINELNEFLSRKESGNKITDSISYQNDQSIESINGYNMDNFVGIETELFEFDPNTIEFNDIIRLGINKPIAQIWINFRNRGGRFQSPDDLLKIYGMEENTYRLLIPYIKIENENHNFEFAEHKRHHIKKDLKINLNSADTIELKKIPGIGTYFANAIIEYRHRLGGFYSKSQLLEIYLIDSLKLEEIKDYIYIDPVDVIKKNINSIDFSSLVSHPYINITQANQIINYRHQHGNFTSMKDLNNIYNLDSTLISKLQVYFYTEM